MTDSNVHGQNPEPEGPGAPHRVIGTPSPAESRSMLAPAPEEEHPPARELPDAPDDEHANNAAKLVAACFILAMLAGLGFVACYFIFNDHSLSAVTHDNLALGTTMALAFLLMGAGATIWVRHVMPKVEIAEERHPLRSSDAARAEFARTFKEGAEASGFVKRPLIRRSLIAATVPVALAPIVLLRDLGPLPEKSLDHTVWKRGTRLVVYGTNRPLTPAEFNRIRFVDAFPRF